MSHDVSITQFVARRMLWAPVAAVGLVLSAIGWFGFQRVVGVVGLTIGALFLIFFVRHLMFAVAAIRSVPSDLIAPVIDAPGLPEVSVLVACRNEEAVVELLVRSLRALDYPADRLQTIIVDDASTDRTPALLESFASPAGFVVVRRPSGATGGKSAALNAGLEVATGEIVLVFDADHRPRPDVVRRLVRHFADPRVAAAQGRCEINNPDDGPLTKLVAIDYLAGYLVNEYGRQALFELPAYGGANCAVRADVLKQLGGWNPQSVTEDTDLTLRVLLAGYRVRYDVTAVDEEEGVVTFGRYWTQRYRWARGHQQAWRDFHSKVWRSPHLGLAQKVETTMFLFAFHLPVVSGVGLLVLGAWFSGVRPPVDPLSLYVFSMLLFVGPLMELGTGLLLSGETRASARQLVYFLPLFFVSIALCTKAMIDGLSARHYNWIKTRRAGDPMALELVAETS